MPDARGAPRARPHAHRQAPRGQRRGGRGPPGPPAGHGPGGRDGILVGIHGRHPARAAAAAMAARLRRRGPGQPRGRGVPPRPAHRAGHAPAWAPEYSDAEERAADRASGWATLALPGPMFTQRLDNLRPFRMPVVCRSPGRSRGGLPELVTPGSGPRGPAQRGRPSRATILHGPFIRPSRSPESLSGILRRPVPPLPFAERRRGAAHDDRPCRPTRRRRSVPRSR